MKIDYPGLLVEKLPSNRFRYRVRVEGDKTRRIRLHVTPDDPDFLEHYRAARVGIELKPNIPNDEKAIPRSVAWLINIYLDEMEKRTSAGQMSVKTLAARKRILGKIRDSEWHDHKMQIPRKKIVELRDSMVATPAQADKTVTELRLLFGWAMDREIVDENPTLGIKKIDPGKGGATAWTVDDLKKYRSHHQQGTTPHLLLTLLMFTACRIGDAVWLGRDQEVEKDGILGLSWETEKSTTEDQKDKMPIVIPMLPPLYKATRAQTVLGKAYVLKKNGQPYSSGDSLSATFVKWCQEAGLEKRSAHGIRKGVGKLLAEEGCTNHQIMAVHGHTQAKTSEIYTRAADRWRLAMEAFKKLEGLEW